MKAKCDFERVFSRGRFTRNPDFIIYHLPGVTNLVRVGICVGKSLGNAVKRNRLKRQIREIIRRLEMDCSPADVAIVARKRLLDQDYHHIKDSLESLLSKALKR